MSDDMTLHADGRTLNVTLTATEKFRRIGHAAYFGMARAGDGPPRMLKVFFPTRDRRVARRVARKMKIKFRKRDGHYHF